MVEFDWGILLSRSSFGDHAVLVGAKCIDFASEVCFECVASNAQICIGEDGNESPIPSHSLVKNPTVRGW